MADNESVLSFIFNLRYVAGLCNNVKSDDGGGWHIAKTAKPTTILVDDNKIREEFLWTDKHLQSIYLI